MANLDRAAELLVKTAMAGVIGYLMSGGVEADDACAVIRKGADAAIAEIAPHGRVCCCLTELTPASPVPAAVTQPANVFATAPPPNSPAWRDPSKKGSHPGLATPVSAPSIKVSKDKVTKTNKKDKRLVTEKDKGSNEKTRSLNVAKMLSTGRLVSKGSK